MTPSLEERVKALEDHIKKESKPDGSDSVKNKKPPREPSEYNKFVKEFIEKERSKHPTKPHKELFALAAKEWQSKKK